MKHGGTDDSPCDASRVARRRGLSAVVLALMIAGLAGAPRASGGDAAPSIRDGSITPEARAFWSFQPLANPPVPTVDDANWSRTEIDRFLSTKHRAAGVTPVGPADRRTLIRRATFDLTGLPPAPDEVDAFLADEGPDAYPKLVERLLASPHYGERWGRHWMDVVRYADTAGETADYPAPHAWRYRNYVINAFNTDKPYDAFLREQLAGDVLGQQLAPETPAYTERFAELVTATGYISIARRFGYNPDADHHLTIEDTIDTLGKSMLGLTIGCARCHDHKYDPILAADFYALYGVFESTRYPYPGAELSKVPRDMVPLMPPAEVERAMKPYRDALAALDAEIAAAAEARKPAESAVQQAVGQGRAALASGEFDNGGAQPIILAGGPVASAAPDVVANALPGATSVKAGQLIQLTILPRGNYGADTTLVELEIAEVGGQGRAWSLTRDVVPDIHAGGGVRDDRTRGNPHADALGNAATWCFLDVRGGNDAAPAFLWRRETGKDAGDGLKSWLGAEDTPIVAANPTDSTRAPITAVLPAKSFYMHPSPAGGVAVAWVSPIDGTVKVSGKVADADPGGGDGVGWTLEHVASTDAGPALVKLREVAVLHDEATKRRAERAAEEPKFPMGYAVAEGTPHESPIHRRGDPKSPGPVVPRGFLQVLGGQTMSPESAGKGSGRLELAGWMTDPNSSGGALAARVMVNRIWQNHFGRGLVPTPSDFGTRGEPPSHPELLEFLARRFVEGGWSVKSMHRMILSSRAYQLASDDHPDNARLDASNSLLWHFARRRLSAEEIRDGILAVSGTLDATPGEGHPFPPENTWQFTQHTPFVAIYETDKRSVYMMTQRIKRHPLLVLFDGPDPNSSTAQRFTTTVAPQSLFFMNDPFVHGKAGKMAERLMNEAPDDAGRLDRAYRLLYGRAPSAGEHEAAAAFLAGYRVDLEQAGVAPPDREPATWAAYCRVLLGSNEFLYVD